MVVVSTGIAIFQETLYYLIISGLIGYLAHIHSRSYYIGIALMMPVMVMISIADMLVFALFFFGLFCLLRFRHWRANVERRNWELFVFVLVFLIDIIVSSTWSEIELTIFKPEFNAVYTPKMNGEWLFGLIGGYGIEIPVALGLSKWLSKIRFTQRELNIIFPQMVYVVVMMMFVIEFLRLRRSQGVYEFLVVAFLLSQVAYSTSRTISTLRKNKQEAEIASVKQQLESMSIYTKQLEQSYDQMRQFRHDFKNLLLAIDANKPEDGKQVQYLAALHDYSDQALAQNVLHFSDLTRVQVPTLKTLIVTKLTLAQQQGIHIHFECLNPITQLASDEITVIRIVGILLDNAIEASAGSVAKQMKLLLIDSDCDQELIIENSYAGQLPSIAQMRKQGFSTKGENRGLGLANVETLLDQHAELALTNYVAAELYGASLVLTKEVTA